MKQLTLWGSKGKRERDEPAETVCPACGKFVPVGWMDSHLSLECASRAGANKGPRALPVQRTLAGNRPPARVWIREAGQKDRVLVELGSAAFAAFGCPISLHLDVLPPELAEQLLGALQESATARWPETTIVKVTMRCVPLHADKCACCSKVFGKLATITRRSRGYRLGADMQKDSVSIGDDIEDNASHCSEDDGLVELMRKVVNEIDR
jgi:hypothetical protein